jgi:hypothetical protein
MELVKGFDVLVLTLLCADNNTRERPHFVLSFKGKVREKRLLSPCRE